MPFVKLNTNATVSESQAQGLLTGLSQLLAQHTGKPEAYVMIEVQGGLSMSFAGNTQPLAYLECKSIGLSTAQVKALAPALTETVAQTLAMANNRIYIEFSNCSAQFWAWNGTTFG